MIFWGSVALRVGGLDKVFPIWQGAEPLRAGVAIVAELERIFTGDPDLIMKVVQRVEDLVVVAASLTESARGRHMVPNFQFAWLARIQALRARPQSPIQDYRWMLDGNNSQVNRFPDFGYVIDFNERVFEIYAWRPSLPAPYRYPRSQLALFNVLAIDQISEWKSTWLQQLVADEVPIALDDEICRDCDDVVGATPHFEGGCPLSSAICHDEACPVEAMHRHVR